MLGKATVLVAGAILIASSLTLGARVDCTRAHTVVEMAICADPKLGGLDRQMNDLYDSLQTSIGDSDRALLAAEQRYWEGERDRNWQKSKSRLRDWYRHRIADLQLKMQIIASASPYYGVYVSPHEVWVSNDNERENMQVADYFSFTRDRRDSAALGFTIKSSCPNYQTCQMTGTAKLNNGRYDYRDIDDTDACKLEITPGNDGILLETPTMEYCKGYCGENCSLDLTHLVLRKIQAVSEQSDIR